MGTLPQFQGQKSTVRDCLIINFNSAEEYQSFVYIHRWLCIWGVQKSVVYYELLKPYCWGPLPTTTFAIEPQIEKNRQNTQQRHFPRSKSSRAACMRFSTPSHRSHHILPFLIFTSFKPGRTTFLISCSVFLKIFKKVSIHG